MTKSLDELRNDIRIELMEHFANIGLSLDHEVRTGADPDKPLVRHHHAHRKAEYAARENALLQRHGQRLLQEHFAAGDMVHPDRIEPEVVMVKAGTEDADLFRFATLLWSVPVSRGYGRRLRFLVRDRSNCRLIGLFGLADPVFNLGARDAWIGWSVQDRRERLVNVMDAFVVGAIPPYTHLLGGKLITTLTTCQEVVEAFRQKYQDSTGIISNQKKRANLSLITVTSALGRSSIYNRVKLPRLVEFKNIGSTEGWGHFQVPDALFNDMRALLEIQGHAYASGHKYGDGPNWRIRVIRKALADVGLDEDLLRHGIRREIFASKLAPDALAFLRGEIDSCHVDRPSAEAIGRAAVQRWMIPRAERRPEFRDWTLTDTWEQLTGQSDLTK